MISNVDVVTFLSGVADKSVDLIIADPPYGIDKDFGITNEWNDVHSWDKWCKIWLIECQRILKPTGNILLYGIHNYLCYNHVTLFDLGMKYRRQFIWYYENGFCGNRWLPRATYEPLLWFSSTDDFYFKEIREPYKSAERLKYNIVKDGKVWKPNPAGRIAGDVWPIPTLAGRSYADEKVDHPSQKPLVLSERLVKHFCPPAGLVVVPFVGSGSECVAALRNGRDFIGTEINSYFRTIAEERIANVRGLTS